MANTPRHSLPLMGNATEQQFATYSAAMALIDGRLNPAVIASQTTPPGVPASGSMYRITSVATGVWAGKENQLAFYINSAWTYITPTPGMIIWDIAASTHYRWTGSAWGLNVGAVAIENADAPVASASTLNFIGSGLVGVTDDGGGQVTVEVSSGADAGGATALPGFMGAQVKKSADQTANFAVAATALTFDTEVFDTNAFHNTGTDTERLTIPAGLGIKKVMLVANVRISGATTSDWIYASIRKNGSTDYDGMANQGQEAGATTASLNMSAIVNVADGDYFDVVVQVETDTSITIEAERTTFSITVLEVEGGVHTHNIKDRTDAAYTYTLNDIGGIIRHDNASPIIATIPANATTAFPIGSTIYPTQWGTGAVSIVPDTGVTLRSRGSLSDLAGQYALATLIKVGTDEWLLSGDLA